MTLNLREQYEAAELFHEESKAKDEILASAAPLSLQKLRAGPKSIERPRHSRIKLSEDEVKTLTSKVSAGSSRSNYSMMNNMNVSREGRHNAVIQHFKEQLISVEESTIESLGKCKDDLIDKIRQLDEQVESVFESELNDKVLGRYRTLDPLTSIWSRISCQWDRERNELAMETSRTLGQLENDLMLHVSEEVRAVFPVLIDIGHQLADDVNRTLEDIVFPYNLRTLERRKEQHLFINDFRLVEIKKRDTDYYTRFQEREMLWKTCRVDGAKEEFTNTFDAIVSNPDFDQLFITFTQAQQELIHTVHSLLREMSEFTTPKLTTVFYNSFVSHTIAGVSEDLAQLHLSLLPKLKDYELTCQSHVSKAVNLLRNNLEVCLSDMEPDEINREVSTIVETTTKDRVKQREEKVLSILKRVGESLFIQQEQRQYEVDRVQLFVQSVARLWDEVVQMIKDHHLTYQTDVTALWDEYNTTLSGIEDEIDSIQRKMTIAPTLNDLEKLHAEIKSKLDRIGGVNVQLNEKGMQRALTLKTQAVDLKTAIFEKLMQFFHIRPVDIEEDVDEQVKELRQKHEGKKEETSPETEEKTEEAEPKKKKGARAKTPVKGKKGKKEESAEPIEEDAKPAEDYPVEILTDKTGTNYATLADLRLLCAPQPPLPFCSKEMFPYPPLPSEEEKQAAEDQPEEKELNQTTKKGKKEAKPKAAPKAAGKGKKKDPTPEPEVVEEEQPVPIEKPPPPPPKDAIPETLNGVTCFVDERIDPNEYFGFRRTVVEAFIDCCESSCNSMIELSNNQSDQDQKQYTVHLADSLRKLRPRAAEIELTIFDIRKGELSEYSERLTREMETVSRLLQRIEEDSDRQQAEMRDIADRYIQLIDADNQKLKQIGTTDTIERHLRKTKQEHDSSLKELQSKRRQADQAIEAATDSIVKRIDAYTSESQGFAEAETEKTKKQLDGLREANENEKQEQLTAIQQLSDELEARIAKAREESILLEIDHKRDVRFLEDFQSIFTSHSILQRNLLNKYSQENANSKTLLQQLKEHVEQGLRAHHQTQTNPGDTARETKGTLTQRDSHLGLTSRDPATSSQAFSWSRPVVQAKAPPQKVPSATAVNRKDQQSPSRTMDKTGHITRKAKPSQPKPDASSPNQVNAKDLPTDLHHLIMDELSRVVHSQHRRSSFLDCIKFPSPIHIPKGLMEHKNRPESSGEGKEDKEKGKKKAAGRPGTSSKSKKEAPKSEANTSLDSSVRASHILFHYHPERCQLSIEQKEIEEILAEEEEIIASIHIQPPTTTAAVITSQESSRFSTPIKEAEEKDEDGEEEAAATKEKGKAKKPQSASKKTKDKGGKKGKGGDEESGGVSPAAWEREAIENAEQLRSQRNGAKGILQHVFIIEESARSHCVALLMEYFFEVNKSKSKPVRDEQICPSYEEQLSIVEDSLVSYITEAERVITEGIEDLQQQVNELTKLLRVIPYVVTKHLLFTEESFFEQNIKSLKNSVSSLLKANETAKDKAKAQLNPTQATEDLQSVLAEVEAQELARMDQIKGSIVEKDIEIEQELTRFGNQITTLLPNSAETLLILSTHALTKDNLNDSYQPFRPSTPSESAGKKDKGAKKAAPKKDAKAKPDPVESEKPFSMEYQVKEWPGIVLTDLWNSKAFPSPVEQKEEKSEEVEEEEKVEERAKTPKGGKKDAKRAQTPKAKAKKGAKEKAAQPSASEGEGEQAKRSRSDGVEQLDSRENAMIVRQRDVVYQEAIAFFSTRRNQLRIEMKDQLDDIAEWADNWQQLAAQYKILL
ncbi:hypothetical protein BLNAU_6415 [Blattamonas nauphoetae]|uniref:Uncharacterized protein n=1 Tax=Blattamonas nauphoetae TaxID=2049346 RepID=A0ABQ9Y4G5_9EUKA|nr:hypothetical protein BLNAU_6415 [Blattamonas nauphoetae]